MNWPRCLKILAQERFFRPDTMETVLKYGSDATLTLDLPGEVLLAECGEPHIQPLDDPAAAVAAALAEPLGFPPLDQCLVPADTMALVLDEDLPQAPLLVAGVIQTLCEAGVAPTSITLVEGPHEDRPTGHDPRSALPADVAPRRVNVIHAMINGKCNHCGITDSDCTVADFRNTQACATECAIAHTTSPNCRKRLRRCTISGLVLWA